MVVDTWWSLLSNLQTYWRLRTLGPQFAAFRSFNFMCVFVGGGGLFRGRWEGPLWEKRMGGGGGCHLKQTSLKSLRNFKCWAHKQELTTSSETNCHVAFSVYSYQIPLRVPFLVSDSHNGNLFCCLTTSVAPSLQPCTCEQHVPPKRQC
jgi:hypothetical protein